MLIKEKESHIGIDIKEESVSAYHSTRKRLQEFIQKKYHVSDLAFSQLTESFKAVFTFLLSGLTYLALAFGATRLGGLIERRLAGGQEVRA